MTKLKNLQIQHSAVIIKFKCSHIDVLEMFVYTIKFGTFPLTKQIYGKYS